MVLFDFIISFATSPGGVKGKVLVGLIRGSNLAIFAPGRAVFDYPIRQRLLKANIPSGFFRFNPFMSEDFLALGLEFAIERGVFQQIIRRG